MLNLKKSSPVNPSSLDKPTKVGDIYFPFEICGYKFAKAEEKGGLSVTSPCQLCAP